MIKYWLKLGTSLFDVGFYLCEHQLDDTNIVFMGYFLSSFCCQIPKDGIKTVRQTWASALKENKHKSHTNIKSQVSLYIKCKINRRLT